MTEFYLEKFLEYIEDKKNHYRVGLEKPNKTNLPKNYLVGCIAGLTIASYFFKEGIEK